MGLKGFVEPMWLALKSMFKKPSTIQYPTEKPILSERYRGRHLLKVEKSGFRPATYPQVTVKVHFVGVPCEISAFYEFTILVENAI